MTSFMDFRKILLTGFLLVSVSQSQASIVGGGGSEILRNMPLSSEVNLTPYAELSKDVQREIDKAEKEAIDSRTLQNIGLVIFGMLGATGAVPMLAPIGPVVAYVGFGKFVFDWAGALHFIRLKLSRSEKDDSFLRKVFYWGAYSDKYPKALSYYEKNGLNATIRRTLGAAKSPTPQIEPSAPDLNKVRSAIVSATKPSNSVFLQNTLKRILAKKSFGIYRLSYEINNTLSSHFAILRERPGIAFEKNLKMDISERNITIDTPSGFGKLLSIEFFAVVDDTWMRAIEMVLRHNVLYPDQHDFNNHVSKLNETGFFTGFLDKSDDIDRSRILSYRKKSVILELGNTDESVGNVLAVDISIIREDDLDKIYLLISES